VMIAARGRLRIEQEEGILTRELAVLAGVSMNLVQKMVRHEPVCAIRLDLIEGAGHRKMRMVTAASAKVLLAREGIPPWDDERSPHARRR